MAIFGKTANASNNKQSTIIGMGAIFKGNLTLSSMIYVDGTIEGDVLSTDSVVVGKNGILKGDVKAKKIVINGEIRGNVVADSIEILAGATLMGDMEVYELSCEPSGRFIGHCKYIEGELSSSYQTIEPDKD